MRVSESSTPEQIYYLAFDRWSHQNARKTAPTSVTSILEVVCISFRWFECGLANPELIRSRMIDRSKSASTPRIWNIAFRAGSVASMLRGGESVRLPCVEDGLCPGCMLELPTNFPLTPLVHGTGVARADVGRKGHARGIQPVTHCPTIKRVYVMYGTRVMGKLSVTGRGLRGRRNPALACLPGAGVGCTRGWHPHRNGPGCVA